ncbi:MAG: acetyl-coenzyme A synthetase N-terminal domain-containing protein, partial [Candidatus Caldarchaeum sp.]
MSEALPFDEYLELPNWRARTVDIEAYKRFWRTTVEDYVGFWEKEAKNLEWFRPWDRVLES